MAVQAQIRPLRPRDIPRCGQIYVDAYLAPPYYGCWDLPTAIRIVEEVSRREGAMCWVSEQRGRVVGFILCTSLAGVRAMVEEFAIDPALQGQGLGSQLFDYALSEFRRRGFSAVELVANQLAPAWKLYESRGFSEPEAYRLLSLNLQQEQATAD